MDAVASTKAHALAQCSEVVLQADENGNVVWTVEKHGFEPHTYRVIIQKNHLILLDAGRSNFCVLDCASNRITKLDDSQRCTLCGEFLCVCNSETPSIMAKEMKPANLATLSDTFPNGATIPCVRGILSKLWDDYKTGGDGDKAWTKQNGTISAKVDGNNIDWGISFWSRDKIPQSAKGKEILIKSKVGDKGMTGIKIKEYEGKESLEISKVAIIEWPGGEPAASGNSKTSGNNKSMDTTQQRNYEIPTAQQLLSDYARIYALVAADPILSPDTDKIANIAATIYIQAHKHGPRVRFEGDPETSGTREPVNSWETFIDPKTKKSLKECGTDRQETLMKWALASKLIDAKTGKEVEGKALELSKLIQVNALAMAASKNITAEMLVDNELEKQDGYTPEKFEAWCQATHSLAHDALTEDHYKDFLTHLADNIKAVMESDESPC